LKFKKPQKKFWQAATARGIYIPAAKG